MKKTLFIVLLALIPILARAQETNGSWVIQKEFPRVLFQQAPKVQFGGSVGSSAADRIAPEVKPIDPGELKPALEAPRRISALMLPLYDAGLSALNETTAPTQLSGLSSMDPLMTFLI